MPTIDLSEPQGLSLFPVLRGGIETVRVLWTESVDNKLVRSSPSIRAVSRFVGHACSAGRGLENGYGVALSFLESNVSPFFKIVRATVAIFRARVSRAISGRQRRAADFPLLCEMFLSTNPRKGASFHTATIPSRRSTTRPNGDLFSCRTGVSL